MELLLIRSPYKMSDFFYKDLGTVHVLYEQMNMIVREIIDQKECIDGILYKIIPNIENDADRREVLSIKRTIFNQLSIFNMDAIERNLSNESDLNAIRKHNEDRKRYKLIYEQFKRQVYADKEFVESKIIFLLKDNWFRSALLSANEGLFKSLQSTEGFRLDKNKYITLLRYLNKSSIMCTPSSLWAGISVARWGRENITEWGGEYKVTLEMNPNSVKHQERNYVKKNVNELNWKKEKFYLNPTIITKDEFIYYWRFEERKMTKCKINKNQFILFIIRQFQNTIFTLSDLSQYIGSQFSLTNEKTKAIIGGLIKQDLLRINSDPLYGALNPLKYAKYSEKDLRKIAILDEKICEFGEAFIEKYSYLSDEQNNVRACMELPWKRIILSIEIKRSLEKAVSYYKFLHAALYDNNKRQVLTDLFLQKFESDKLIPLLEVSEELASNNLPNYINSNYRAWDTNKEGFNYKGFIDLIKANDMNKKEVVLREEELTLLFEDRITNQNILSCQDSEAIFQFYQKDGCYFIIPEMFSTQYGRFSGRFVRMLEGNIQEEFNQQIYNSIKEKEHTYQVNLHINNELDGIGFNLPQLINKITLYDNNVSENERQLPINKLFIKLNSETEMFSFHRQDGHEINLWLSSTISPGNDKLYRLINNITQQNLININGHARNRIELDTDHQPRILLENLVISRERFRIKVGDFIFLYSNLDDHLKMEKLLELINIHNLPNSFFVYTDGNFKPQFVETATIYDLYILQRIIKTSKQYVYIEEVLPGKESYWLKSKFDKYNGEVWARV
ncbi:hypothetical protein J41TS12_30650 [Paenibacillus antibioticophila]|uniref:Lantibiotic dehydratase N-terminal domain-containing protein n=1 Tax=Paenibacillus antibioticophila TaxID=1274374 RepID=A0A919XUG3_9BACL|nr:lantibiotic dehydratase [Paenibacillus antibioticophila]GIO38204.1 hypothetical protein J41TS12_30650 [Paenibacillus antibioticophila]